MSSPYSALAAKVREKYPGEYDHLSDDDLGKKVVAKYPQYQSLVRPIPGDVVGRQTFAPLPKEIQPVPRKSVRPFETSAREGAPVPANIEAAGEAQEIRQKRFETATQRAEKSPTPITEATSVVFPQQFGVEGLPSKVRAGAKFEEVMKAAGKTPVNVEEVGEAGARVKQLVERGSSPVQVINKFMRRIEDTEKGPITFDEARDFYVNARMNMMERWRNVGGPMWRQVAIFKEALGNAIEDAAKEAGKLDEYLDAMKEYRQAAILKKLGLGAGATAVGKGISKLPVVGSMVKGAVKGSLNQ